MYRHLLSIFFISLVLSSCSWGGGDVLQTSTQKQKSEFLDGRTPFPGNTQSSSGALIDIYYPSARTSTGVSAYFANYFTDRISVFQSDIASGSTLSGITTPYFRSNYTIYPGSVWDTVVFDIEKQLMTGSVTRANPVFYVSHTGSITTLRDIISLRYLYTLKKEIEKQASGSTVAFTYEGIAPYTQLDDSKFIYRTSSGAIELPLSSYFFDLWNPSPSNSGSAFVREPGKKYVALTFDDGPSIKYTNGLLDTLKRSGVHATFYVVGTNADRYPDILRRIHAEGHEIGNHSYAHPLYTRLTDQAILDDMYKCDQAIYKAIGEYPRTMRHPYGGINPRVLALGGMPSILWSIDTYDWKTRNSKKDVLAASRAQDGDILLFHDIHQSSVDSIPEVVRVLKEKGYEFVTVSQLLEISDRDTQAGKKCNRRGNCK